MNIGDTVVVAGADLVGVETAWHLATSGRKVTLIDPREGYGEDVNLVSKLVLPDALKQAGAEVLFDCEILGSERGILFIERETGPKFIETETLVAANGLQPMPTTQTETIPRNGKHIHRIGEASGLLGLRWATHTADEVARGL